MLAIEVVRGRFRIGSGVLGTFLFVIGGRIIVNTWIAFVLIRTADVRCALVSANGIRWVIELAARPLFSFNHFYKAV